MVGLHFHWPYFTPDLDQIFNKMGCFVVVKSNTPFQVTGGSHVEYRDLWKNQFRWPELAAIK